MGTYHLSSGKFVMFVSSEEGGRHKETMSQVSDFSADPERFLLFVSDGIFAFCFCKIAEGVFVDDDGDEFPIRVFKKKSGFYYCDVQVYSVGQVLACFPDATDSFVPVRLAESSPTGQVVRTEGGQWYPLMAGDVVLRARQLGEVSQQVPLFPERRPTCF